MHTYKYQGNATLEQFILVSGSTKFLWMWGGSSIVGGSAPFVKWVVAGGSGSS